MQPVYFACRDSSKAGREAKGLIGLTHHKVTRHRRAK